MTNLCRFLNVIAKSQICIHICIQSRPIQRVGGTIQDLVLCIEEIASSDDEFYDRKTQIIPRVLY